MRFITQFVAITLFIAPLVSAAAAPKPVLVELFTSEGCSSCPPADALLRHLAEKQPIAGVQIIALSEHVDYWNNYGWVDRFSARQFTHRQQQYATAFDSNTVYTPQMVVNGERQFVGSNRRRAIGAIEREANTAQTRIILTLTQAHDGEQPVANIRIDARDLRDGGAGANVWLAVTEDNLHTDVRGGENGGSRLEHTAVVRRLTRIGGLRNAANDEFSRRVEVAVSPQWQGHLLHVVVFVQNSGNRHILGAASQTLKPS